MTKKSKNNQPRNLGIEGVEPVARTAAATPDPKCPFNGSVKLRGKSFIGTVSSDKMHKTATVFWERKVFVPKFERYEKRFTKIHCHNPEAIDAKQGDKVLVMETRPLSKTKKFVIIKVLGKNIDYEIKDQLIKQDELKAKSDKDKKIKSDKHKDDTEKYQDSDEDADSDAGSDTDSEDFGADESDD